MKKTLIDGLSQIATYVQGRSGIDALHIMSHGSQGALYLGNAVSWLQTVRVMRLAADEQRYLAAQARGLSSQQPAICPKVIVLAPNLACVASRCQVAPLTPSP